MCRLVFSTCLEYLQQYFDFKRACLSNDDCLKIFVHPTCDIKLCLEEIISNKVVMLNTIKCEQENICRFCLRHRNNASFTKLNTNEENMFLKDMLEKCLPELDLSITDNPLMCQSCMESLQDQFNFIMTCLNSNENIKHYTTVKGMGKREIELSDVLNFIKNKKKDDNKKNLNYTKLKQENEFLDDATLHIVTKKEEEFEMVEEVGYHVKIDDHLKLKKEHQNRSVGCNQPKETSYSGGRPLKKAPKVMYRCTKCPHQTNRKNSLELHYLVHEEPTKCEMFKCEKCDFTTKWRSSLTKHHILHRNPSEIVMFQCAHCSYKTKYKKHLRRHCKIHMKAVWKPYLCQYCSFKSGNKWSFKQHNKNKHKKDVVLEKDPFTCLKCNFEAAYKIDLDEHMWTGHSIARYVCKCGYSTQKLDHFKDHSLKHKSRNEVKMHICDKCHFQTKYRQSYKKHLLLHESRK